MGEKARRTARRTGSGSQRTFLAENLERRLLLSSAIAAFGLQQTFATGTQPRAVAIADVNLDGKPDLLIANAVSNTVSVLLGNGNGTFQPQLTFATGSNPFAISVADVNLDGKPDLIVANNASNSVSVLLGNGNGTFQPQLTFTTGAAPRSVAVADVNGDGKPDIVAGNYNANSVSILLGTGTGSFGTQTTFATGTQPRSLAVADVNLDGKPDLITANHASNSVSVLLNSGTGIFPTQTTFATGTSPFSVATSDVNQDGKPDILVANNGSNSVGVLLNTGAGSFSAQQTFAAGSGPIAIDASDVNGDGKPDILVANYNANTASVLLGNGDGIFQAQKTFAVGAGPRSIAVADLNRDGRLDLVGGNSVSNSVSALLGDVPPTVLSINRSNPAAPVIAPTSTVTYAVTFSEPVSGVDATDFSLALSSVTATTPVGVSGSGAVYTVTISGISGAGRLGLNLVDDGTIKDAAGNPLQPGDIALFQPQQTFATGFDSGPVAVVTADINGDGKPDVAVAHNGSGGTTVSSVGVFLSNGDGTLAPQQTFAANTQAQFQSLAVGDLNADGKIDVVEGGMFNAGVLLGNGNGTFQALQTLAPGSGQYGVSIGDLNGDGKPDLVVSPFNGNFIQILLGNGNGTFQAPRAITLGQAPGRAAIADLNQDGKPDLVVPVGEKNLEVLLGNGDGTFQVGQTFGYSAGLDVALGDFNGDGRIDIATTSFQRPFLSVFLGNGNGTFGSQQTFATGTNPSDIEVADLNGDGKLDLVVSNESLTTPPGSVGVLLGNGDGSFQPQRTFAAGAQPTSISIADMNGDGHPDLVVANLLENNVGILLGTASGGFVGQTYTITPPAVVSIARSVPATTLTAASTVTYAVAFNDSVTGVAASDFRVVASGGVVALGPVTLSGSGSSYTVSVAGIKGTGTLQLDLVDDDSIHDSSGFPLGGDGVVQRQLRWSELHDCTTVRGANRPVDQPQFRL